MKPYYEQDGITIYHGDCRDVWDDVDGTAPDACVTDPPWNCGYFKDDNKEWAEYADWLEGMLGIFSGIQGQCWFVSMKSIPHVAGLFDGFTPFASVKNFTQMTKHAIPNAWDIAFIRDQAKCYHGTGRNWFLCNTAGMLKERTAHPTPRTSDVMKFIIGMYDWPLIIDPFMGSGTTLRAAKDMGRKAIGIELEERYCEIAAERLAQRTLFEPEPAPEPPPQTGFGY